jgi:hypothetical protein
MADGYLNVMIKMPYKTLQRIEQMAEQNSVSRAKMIIKILDAAVINEGLKTEVSSATSEGARDKNGVPIAIINSLREVL